MTSPEYAYISSGILKQIASLGGDIAPFVPACILSEVNDRIRAK